MADNLRLKITAVDEAAPILEKLRTRINRLNMPANRAARSMQAMSEKTAVIENFAKGRAMPSLTNRFEAFSLASFKAFRNVGRLSSEFSALSALAPTAGFLASLGAAGALTKQWADQGVRMRSAAANIGLTVGELQRFQRIGALAGVSSGSMTGVMAALSNDAYLARTNQNPQMVQAFRQMGVSLMDKRGHARSASSVAIDVSRSISKLNGVAQAQALQALGIGPEAAPFFRMGPARIAAENARLKAAGMTSDAYAGSDKLYEDFAKLDTALIDLKNVLAKDISPSLDRIVTGITGPVNWMASPARAKHRVNWLDWAGMGVSNWLFGTHLGEVAAAKGTAPGGPAMDRAQKAMKFFIGKGLSPAQAAGLVGGGPMAKSMMNPNARNGQHYGLAQWNLKRQQQIQAALGAGALSGFDNQLNAIWWELNHGEKGSLARLKGAKTAKDAADIIRGNVTPNDTSGYERPGYNPADIARREGLAAFILKNYAGAPAGETGGKVTVDINHSHVPAGVTTGTGASGNAEIGSLRINKSMPEAQP